MNAERLPATDDLSDLDDCEIGIELLTSEEAWAVFNEAAQRDLHMNGAEFLRRWDAGEWREDPDQPGVIGLAMLIPFVR